MQPLQICIDPIIRIGPQSWRLRVRDFCRHAIQTRNYFNVVLIFYPRINKKNVQLHAIKIKYFTKKN